MNDTTSPNALSRQPTLPPRPLMRLLRHSANEALLSFPNEISPSIFCRRNVPRSHQDERAELPTWLGWSVSGDEPDNTCASWY